ncbi:MAG TPA: peroxiredoxin [Chthonomonadales bacterium]|nr:peroxiredoxin [Chthonomonadales bacterium]
MPDHQTPNTVARVGQPAPDFTMKTTADMQTLSSTASLNDYRGKWLVLFFYPLNFTFVCPTEILALSDRYEEFTDLGADVLGVSTDSVYSHRAWINTPRDQNGIEGLRYPIASDITKEVARSYGVLIEEEGIALRGLFIIDPEGVLQYSVINSLSIGRSVDETLRVLEALQTGGLCGADWRPGQSTLEV